MAKKNIFSLDFRSAFPRGAENDDDFEIGTDDIPSLNVIIRGYEDSDGEMFLSKDDCGDLSDFELEIQSAIKNLQQILTEAKKLMAEDAQLRDVIETRRRKRRR